MTWSTVLEMITNLIVKNRIVLIGKVTPYSIQV